LIIREQKLVGKKLKVGHGGTLDPMATGVLVIGVGTGCRALGSYLSGSKAYLATGRFGKSFDTLDCTGRLVEEKELPEGLTKESFTSILASKFTGNIMQRPPAFSAIHVNGERAYDLARDGQQVEIPARPVKIDSIRLVSWELPEFKLEVECGGGMYVRSLIADAAVESGSIASMYALERTKQGQFTLDSCISIEDCKDLERIQSVMHQTSN